MKVWIFSGRALKRPEKYGRREKRGDSLPKYPKIAGTASPLRLRRSEGPKLPPGRTGSFTSGSRWIQRSRRYRRDLSTHPDSARHDKFVSGKIKNFFTFCSLATG